jgi:WXXGXW repeat (2 copies)
MTLPRLTIAAAFAVLLTAATACAAPRGRAYVRVAPPPPVVERVVVAPGPGYVWVPGYHLWSGSAYVWHRGAWVVPPRPRAVWVAPHWQHERRGWYFVEGHWR